jgi:glycogen debranching enzyme
MTLATNVDHITVIEHAAFVVSDQRGDIIPGGYHGFYVADTRYLSRCILRLGGRRLERLSPGAPDHQRASFYLANPRVGRLGAGTVAVFRDRQIDGGIAERIRLISYSPTPMRLRLSIQLGADFVDIFEVLGRVPLRRSVSVEVVEGAVRFAYQRGGYRRSTTVGTDRRFRWERDRLTFDLVLRRGEPWDLTLRIDADERVLGRSAPTRPAPEKRAIDRGRVERWAASAPRLETDDPRLARTYRAAIRDLKALLLAEPGGSFIPAAGLPWFMAVFGRDASITAMQTLIAGSDIAYGTLRELGSLQGQRDDPFRDEEPGRIPHEVRRGELAMLDRVPHARYYGSVDATPLYVRLFGEACRWSGWLIPGQRAGPMPAALRNVLPHVERALAWIDRRAEGRDGLIWYQRRHRTGIRNQVWKDSGDSYRFANGQLAATPIAALEVQGYAVAAWRAMADVYEALGRTKEAARRRTSADEMARRIDDVFWMPAIGTFAMGVDRYGRQIDSVTSNPGHLLWSGAVTPERAAQVADRIAAPDMFTGWGVRTMSSEMGGYNPMSYHNGSIWPHDNSIIVAGLLRYGADALAWRIVDGLLDAAMTDPAARLPELFAGFDRSATPDFVGYPVACAPQAWASGAILHFIQSLLRLEPGPEKPGLNPTDLGPRLTLTGIRVGTWAGDLHN